MKTQTILIIALLLVGSTAYAGDSMFVRSDGSIDVIKGKQMVPVVEKIVEPKDNSMILSDIRAAITESVRAEFIEQYGLKTTATWEEGSGNWCYDDHKGTHMRTRRLC